MTPCSGKEDADPDKRALLELLRAMRRHLDGADEVIRLRFDDETVSLWARDATGGLVLRAAFAWASVTRVCFKDNGPLISDHLYVFTRERGSVLVVPLEAEGGGEFWRQLPARGLFPAWLHERATLSMDGRLYCWPRAGCRRGTRAD